MAGTGATRYSYNGHTANALRNAIIEIKEKQNPDAIAFWTSYDPKYIGSVPESSGSQPDYTAVASAVVSYAITAINSLPLSFAWTTISLLAAMHSVYDSSTNSASKQSRVWAWSPDVSDVGQFFWFLVDVSPNSQASFTVEYAIVGPSWELVDIGPHEYLCTTPGPGSKSTPSKDWNPGMMTDAEKELYGIEEIPITQLSKRATELNIPPETVQELISNGESVVYYAHNLPVQEITKSKFDSVIPNN